MEKNKFKLIIMSVLIITMLLGVAAWAFFDSRGAGINPGGAIAMAIPVLIGIFMIFFVVRRYRDLKSGMPLEDERSKKVMNMAAAKSFYISIYWLLALSWFSDVFAEKLFDGPTLTASETTGGGIAGMALIFFACWFYYDKKGKI